MQIRPVLLLKAGVRWSGAILVGVSLLLVATDLTLLQILLPFRAVVVGGAAVGAAICLIRAWRGQRRVALLLVGLCGLSLATWQARVHYFSYRQAEVTFSSQGTTLAGALYLPRVEGRSPALVIVHGSGNPPRFIYHYWADHWVRRGYVVLLYDKRGTGRSGGDYESDNNTSRKNIEQLAQDASAALEMLRSRPEVLADKAGFWGISQAGWIVPRAAVINGHAAFMVLVSGPTVTVGEEDLYSGSTGDMCRGTTSDVAEAERAMAQTPSRGFDPVPDLRALDIPGLWLQGELDGSVPPNRNAQLVEALRADGKPYETRMFPGAGHVIFLPRRGLRPPRPAPGFWEAQEEWLGRVATSAGD